MAGRLVRGRSRPPYRQGAVTEVIWRPEHVHISPFVLFGPFGWSTGNPGGPAALLRTAPPHLCIPQYTRGRPHASLSPRGCDRGDLTAQIGSYIPLCALWTIWMVCGESWWPRCPPPHGPSVALYPAVDKGPPPCLISPRGCDRGDLTAQIGSYIPLCALWTIWMVCGESWWPRGAPPHGPSVALYPAVDKGPPPCLLSPRGCDRGDLTAQTGSYIPFRALWTIWMVCGELWWPRRTPVWPLRSPPQPSARAMVGHHIAPVAIYGRPMPLMSVCGPIPILRARAAPPCWCMLGRRGHLQTCCDLSAGRLLAPLAPHRGRDRGGMAAHTRLHTPSRVEFVIWSPRVVP